MAHYTRDNKSALVAQRGPSATHYYLVDALGSVVGLTDASGSLAATYRYDPYGKLVSSTGSLSNPWRFASGYFDSSTGFYKFGTRYYDPTLGRWTQPDPLSGKIADPTTLNRYQYAACDAVNKVDPTGREANAILCAGAVAGAAAALFALGYGLGAAVTANSLLVFLGESAGVLGLVLDLPAIEAAVRDACGL